MPRQVTIYTLNIDGYEPQITGLTHPLMRGFCEKIGAEFYVIDSRKFPDWPVTYEKMQIYELARERKDDWAWFLDSDALVSPEMFDVTDHLKKDTVAHNASDMAGLRWSYDDYFRRDGRNFGSCNWCSIASDWCLDLWRPLDDLTLDQALANIHPRIGEKNSGFCDTRHLIDDYTLSRNIAKFGLKATTLAEMCLGLGWKDPRGAGTNPHLWHHYQESNQQKVREMLAILGTPFGHMAFAVNGEPVQDNLGNVLMKMPNGTCIGSCGMGWGLMSKDEVTEYRKKWKIF